MSEKTKQTALKLILDNIVHKALNRAILTFLILSGNALLVFHVTHTDVVLKSNTVDQRGNSLPMLFQTGINNQVNLM